MLTEIIFVEIGLLLMLALGSACDRFLERSVTAEPTIGWHEAGGGGKQLGVIERLLFFSSFWLGEYAIAGGWLVFKAAGKWAAW
jgi:hypothetical protein